MKKVLKILIALTLAVVMLASLCSCIDVKEMRRSQGYYTDETQKSVVFNGKTYDLIEDWADNLDVFLPKDGSVSEKGKPLLIASLTGDDLQYNDSGIIISAGYRYYCLREEYQNMLLKLADIKFENYCIKSFGGDGIIEEVEEEVVILDEQFIEAIEEVLKNTTPSYDEFIYFEDAAVVYKCDESKTFLEQICRVGYTYEGEYYIEVSGYNTRNDDEIDATKYYFILPSQVAPFKKLIDEGYNYY